MKTYNDDNLVITDTDNKKVAVNKKIKLLKQFHLLRKNDPREEAVRSFLLSLPNFTRLDNIIHDLLVGNRNINEIGG